MSKKNNLKDFLTDVAHAIKIKVPDVATPINPQDFSNIVRSISGGGGEEEYKGENTPLDVKPTSETWLLNETIDTSKSVNITSNISCTISLLIDNQGTYISKSGTTINVFGGAGGPYIIDVDSSGNRLVYYDALGGWNSQYDQAYYKTNDTSKLRTITFSTSPIGDLLTWLQANGIKASNLVTFTVETGVHGKYVKYEDCQGEDGMLFTDWISSAYNTHNIVYPVAAEDCPEGYIPITFADDETIPNTNGGFLSLIREYAPSIN